MIIEVESLPGAPSTQYLRVTNSMGHSVLQPKCHRYCRSSGNMGHPRLSKYSNKEGFCARDCTHVLMKNLYHQIMFVLQPFRA